MKSIYLDWAASAPIDPNLPSFISKILLGLQGNPSSIHAKGEKVRNHLNSSRKLCANLLGTKPEQLIFTSGGTESNNIILTTLFRKKSKGHIIISTIEHSSIYEYSKVLNELGFDISYISPDSDGFIDPYNLIQLLKSNTIFISIMTVNNETGAIQPLKDIIPAIRVFEKKNKRSIHIHTDAVQALGKIQFKPTLIDIDSASFSAHKIGSLTGTGLLYLKKKITVLSSGGGQEFSIRPGTENILGILAFSRVLEKSMRMLNDNLKHVEYLKSLLCSQLIDIKGLKLLFTSVTKNSLAYSPYITSATVFPVPGEVLVRVLSDDGIFISTGSACSSRNRKKQIRMLVASGASEKEATGSIRISIGWATTETDIINFCNILKKKLFELRKYL